MSLTFQQWLQAISDDEQSIVLDGLRHGVRDTEDDLNGQEIDPTFALGLACSLGNVHLTSLLIDQNADINGVIGQDGPKGRFNQQTPFMIAMREQRFDVARLLIDRGCQTTWIGTRHNGLHHSNDPWITKHLLDQGVDPRHQDTKDQVPVGPSPLHMVENEDCIRMLLEHGADPNAFFHPSAFHTRFVVHCIDNPSVIEVMAQHGLNPNAQDSEGKTALHYAQSKEMVDALVKAGADIDLASHAGQTPLFQLNFQRSRLPAIKALLSHGADPDHQDALGFSPLHWAAQQTSPFATKEGKHSLEVMKALLACGANPNIQGREGLAPLHRARSKQAAKALLDYGADPLIKNDQNQTPLKHYKELMFATGIENELMTCLIHAEEDARLKMLLQAQFQSIKKTKSKSHARAM